MAKNLIETIQNIPYNTIKFLHDSFSGIDIGEFYSWYGIFWMAVCAVAVWLSIKHFVGL
jgi:hypothetical protein